MASLVVGYIDGGDTESGLQRRNLGARRDAELGVEVRQRLVHQEDLRGANDGAAHGDALTLAARKRLRLAVEEVFQAKQMSSLLNALLTLRLGNPSHLQCKAHVVAHGHMGVQSVVLEDHGDVTILGRQVGDVALTDPDSPGIDLLQACEHPKGGRLPAAGWSDQDHEFAVTDVQIEFVDGGFVCSRINPGRILE